MTLRRVAIPSPNYSSRAGSAITTIVLHTAEGATTYQSLGAYFQNPGAQVSSHVGIDDTAGTIGEYVPRSGKAWTAANANPWAVQAELCGFAKWDSAEWQRHPTMLANTAAWIAEESAALGIPIVKLTAAQAQNSAVKGVCQHYDLGTAGGNHWDCGPAFPIDQVLSMALGGMSPTPPPLETEEPEMILIRKPNGEYSTFTGAERLRVSGPTDLAELKKAGVKEANVSEAYYNSIPPAK